MSKPPSPPDLLFTSDRPDRVAIETPLSDGRTAKYWFAGETVRLELWRGARRLQRVALSRADWLIFMTVAREQAVLQDIAALQQRGMAYQEARAIVEQRKTDLYGGVTATLRSAEPARGGSGQASGHHVAVTSQLSPDGTVSGAMRFHRRAAEDLRQLTTAAEAFGVGATLLRVVDGEAALRSALRRDYFQLLKPPPALTRVVPDYVRVRSQVRAGNARRLVVGAMRALQLSEYQRQEAVLWLARGMADAA